MKFHQGLAVLLALLIPFATVGDTDQKHRRLSDSSVSQFTAEKACEHWGAGKDDCVFDVLSTGDLDMALDGEY
jgi:hypothetical protein